MFKKVILIVGLFLKNICDAMIAPVPYDNWDNQARAIVRDIIANPTKYQDQRQREFKLDILRPYLNRLQGGAYRVYCEFLENWQTGDSEEDYVPNELELLATQIYQGLLNN